MYEFIIPSEIGLDKDDFEFEILESKIYDEASFCPRERLKVKINNVIINLNVSSVGDLEHLKAWGYSQKEINRLRADYVDSLKFEAMLKYVNTKQFKRKLKLEKINKSNGN